MAKEMYLIYNEITQDYSLGCKAYRRIMDDRFIKILDVINHIKYETNIGVMNSKRKMEFITNVPKEDFEELKKGLEKTLKKTRFISKKL